MAKRGAQPGNNNATKGAMWSDAIRAALIRRQKTGKPGEIRDLADKLIDKALEGDMSALKEFGDRMEGKAIQPISGEGGGPVQFEILAPWLKQTIANRNKG